MVAQLELAVVYYHYGNSFPIGLCCYVTLKIHTDQGFIQDLGVWGFGDSSCHFKPSHGRRS